MHLVSNSFHSYYSLKTVTFENEMSHGGKGGQKSAQKVFELFEWKIYCENHHES